MVVSLGVARLGPGKFLLRQGRIEEGRQVADRAVQAARQLGPNSPIIEVVKQRLAAAEAEAAPRNA